MQSQQEDQLYDVAFAESTMSTWCSFLTYNSTAVGCQNVHKSVINCHAVMRYPLNHTAVGYTRCCLLLAVISYLSGGCGIPPMWIPRQYGAKAAATLLLCRVVTSCGHAGRYQRFEELTVSMYRAQKMKAVFPPNVFLPASPHDLTTQNNNVVFTAVRILNQTNVSISFPVLSSIL